MAIREMIRAIRIEMKLGFCEITLSPFISISPFIHSSGEGLYNDFAIHGSGTSH
jgi:hypothetical protein